MTVRNIRAHQTRGLLPPPVVRGRTGYYNEEHVARIELTREMQAEGLNLEAIRRMARRRRRRRRRRSSTSPAPCAPPSKRRRRRSSSWPSWRSSGARRSRKGAASRCWNGAKSSASSAPCPTGKVEVISPRMMDAAAALAEVGMSPDAVLAVGREAAPQGRRHRPALHRPLPRAGLEALRRSRPPRGRLAQGARSARAHPARSAPTSSWASSRSRWPRRPTRRSSGRSAASPASETKGRQVARQKALAAPLGQCSPQALGVSVPRPMARVAISNTQDDHHREQAHGCGRQDLSIADTRPTTQGESGDQADDEKKDMVVTMVAHRSRP